MPVFHNKTVTIADGTNSNIVRPSDWNSAHALTLSGSEVVGVFSNANGVSFGLSGDSITASHNALTNQTQFVLSESNGLSWGTNVSTVTGSYSQSTHSHSTFTQSIQPVAASGSNGSFLFSTLEFVTGNGATFYTDATGIRLSYTVPAPGGGDAIRGIAAGASTATTNTVNFSNSNGVSFGFGAGANSTVITASYDSTRIAGVGETTGTTAGTDLKMTVNTDGVNISFPKWITTAMASDRGTDFVQATAAFAGTNANGTIASGGISVSAVPRFGAITLAGNSAGTNTFHATNNSTLWLNGGNNITLSGNGSTITIVGGAGGGGVQSVGVSTGGNTQGTTGLVSNQMVLVGGANITLSQSSAAGGNATVTISAPNPGGGAGIDRSYFEIMDGERLTTAVAITHGSYSKRPFFVPFWMDQGSLGLNTVRIMVSRPAGTSLNMTYGVAFYSHNDSSRITLYASTTHAISLTASAQFSGIRIMDITGMGGSSLSEGRWVMALYFSGSNNSTAVMNLNIMGGDQFALAGWLHPGTNSTGATATQSRVFPFWGVYTVTTAGFPVSAGSNQVAFASSNAGAADVWAAIFENNLT